MGWQRECRSLFQLLKVAGTVPAGSLLGRKLGIGAEGMEEGRTGGTAMWLSTGCRLRGMGCDQTPRGHLAAAASTEELEK